MWLRLYIFPLLVVRTIICIQLYSSIQIHRYYFIIIFKELYICSRVLVILSFLLLSLTKSIYIASTIRKYYTRLSFPSTVVTYTREPNRSQVRLFAYTLSKRCLLCLSCFEDFWLCKALRDRISTYGFELFWSPYRRGIVRLLVPSLSILDITTRVTEA